MHLGVVTSRKTIGDLQQADQFLSLSLDLFSLVDADGIIRRVSPHVEGILGFGVHEFVGRSVFDFVLAEDHDAARIQLQKAAAGEAFESFECRCSHRDGSYRWVDFSCPALSQDGMLLVTARDVTEQKQLQLSLLEWEQRYTAAMRATGSVVYECDPQTGRVMWEDNLESLLGYRLEEMDEGERSWLSVIHPDDRRGPEQVMREGLTNHEPARLTYRVRRKDGAYILVEDDVHVLREPGSRRVKMMGCLRDVAQRRSFEEQFQHLLEAVPTGIALVDQAGRILSANSRLEAQFGYAAGELQGHEIECLVPNKYRGQHRRHRETYQAAPAARPLGRALMLWGLHKDGRELPVDVALRPVTIQDRSLTVCSVVDLSERVGTERALHESERRLRDILDNTSAVMYVKDLDGRFLLINRQFEQSFHITREAIIGQTDFQVFSPEVATAFRANDQRVIESGEALEVEEHVPHDDGLHSYLSVKFPLRNGDSKIYATAGISTDITERVRADQEVQQMRRRMELIVNAITDGIFGVDVHGKITFANPAAEQMLGWTSTDLVGRASAEMLQETFADGSPVAPESDLISRALVSGEGQQADNRLFYRRDGSNFPVDYRCTPLVENGRLVGTVVTFHDLTERKLRQQAEHELQAAHRVQQRLYPRAAPSVPGFDLAGAAFPASQACGDYFDFIPLRDGSLALVVADVAGHGLGPALQMVQVRAYLRAMLSGGMACTDALRELNRLMLADSPQDAFVTLFLTILDPRRRSLIYVGAGHEACLLRAGGGSEILGSTGIVLGVLPGAPVQSRGPLQIQSGDLLLMLTDGVLESYSPQKTLFGWDRTLNIVREHQHRSAAEIIHILYLASRRFTGGSPQADDVTVLIAKAL